MGDTLQFPPQQLPFSRKNKAWRKKHCDWADARTFFNYSPVRQSMIHKKINYDLLNGKLHMKDLMAILNPEDLKAGFIPERIQHYPIMNSKLNVLRGEESKRAFDYRVIITNPNALSEREEEKKRQMIQSLQQLVEDTSMSDKEYNEKIGKMEEYFRYEWQDMREVRANALLQHYSKEQNFKLIFNQGFMDAMVGEEMYICDIVGGEPVLERLNPNNVTCYRSGYSNRIEDADIIVIEDYWSPGRIIDTYYDVLTEKDRKYIESMPVSSDADAMDNVDERNGFIYRDWDDGGLEYTSEMFFGGFEKDSAVMPYDMAGNIKVLRVFWKSRRKVKKVRSFNPVTGEEEFNFYPETYRIHEELGEEEQVMYINEAWEGTKIGKDVYVNMRPRLIQYNRLSNPSRCHFGIIGTVYNFNDSKPFSMVDMMKTYNYMYDVTHDRLNKLMAKNWGKIVMLDLAKVPAKWDIDKWMYFAKTNNIAVVDSFKEGNIGAATGVMAGAMNNASSGVIDAELGNSIQYNINLLEFLKMEMSEVAGISPQREGQISTRETVGGVERATLQSSHITEWLFLVHDDVKKRVLECFLETAKIAMRGRSKKFEHILSDGSVRMMEIDGDEFSECDYGLVVDTDNSLQQLHQKLDMLAQAALQNQLLDFSTIMKLYGSSSLMEKQRMVENSERQMKEMRQQEQQQTAQLQQQQIEQEARDRQAQMQLQDTLNQRDNETRILVAEMRLQSKSDGIIEPEYSQEAKDRLMEQMREFDQRLQLDREKLELDKKKARTDASLRRQQMNNGKRKDT